MGEMRRIIVADDDQGVADLLRRTLVRNGYQVSLASNGDELLKLFRQEQSDAAVVDIEMPVKDGLQAIGELRAEAPNLVIVAVSGARNNCSLALESGADAFLPKPTAPREILSCLEKLLGAGGRRSPA